MLFKLSSTSASDINQSIVTKEEGYHFFKDALEVKPKYKISLGILFCAEFEGNLCSGTDSKGSNWGFSVYCKSGKYNQEKQEAIEHQGVEYDLRRESVQISYYDLIIHHRIAACGCKFYRIDACLPRKWCNCISQIKSIKTGEERLDLVGGVIEKILNEAKKYSLENIAKTSYRETVSLVH